MLLGMCIHSKAYPVALGHQLEFGLLVGLVRKAGLAVRKAGLLVGLARKAGWADHKMVEWMLRLLPMRVDHFESPLVAY